MPHPTAPEKTDVVLVGAGIMSATLGALLRLLEPDWSITLVERLDAAAAESSGSWNNAGTGHSALCELNYTPQRADGSIDITRAVKINEQFQLSRQFWAHGVQSQVLTEPRSWLNPVPHVAFVSGAAQVDYLRRCRESLVGNPLFAAMEFVDDPAEFARRLPLMARQRDFSEPVALNWTENGADVDFGSLSRQLIGFAVRNGTTALFGHEVRGLRREPDGTWDVRVVNRRTKARRAVKTRFVFVGAGGWSLPLLQRAGLPEVKGYGGFPVSGRFLRTDNLALTAAHDAKVYGCAAPGAPKMSAPHLDARIVNGKRSLLFGPYAGWSPKFLKHGRYADLPRSVTAHNGPELLSAAVTQRAFVRYLLGQLLLSPDDRVRALREFVPSAAVSDWETLTAGQRVQVIRPEGRKGVLEVGTTIITGADGTVAGLLGASPGASTAVADMLEVISRCFPGRYQSWLPKLEEMMPSLGTKLSDEPRLFGQVWEWGTRMLNQHGPPSATAAGGT